MLLELRFVSHGVRRATPYLLALFFGLWGLRGVTVTDVVDTDAVRHAMNGAFLYDFFRHGKFTTPIEYGYYYYSHLPALSLPYHPPLFPMFEALLFSGLGVNLLTARLAVAIATALACFLLYHLLIMTHNSHTLALVATVTFFSMSMVRWLAQDVMLEFPSLVFVLCSLYGLHDIGHGWPLRRILLVATCAGAAVWTKQTAAFLGLMPFFYVVISRRWHLLCSKTIWLFSLCFCFWVLALFALSLPFQGTLVSPEIRVIFVQQDRAIDLFAQQLWDYIRFMYRELGTIPAAFIALAFLGLLGASRPQDSARARNDLYLAWVFASLLVLPIRRYDGVSRYLFLVYPPLIVLGYVALFHLCTRCFSSPWGRYIPAAIALCFCMVSFYKPPTFLHGPSQAAAHIVTGATSRVLYCGQTDGNFIFAVRTLGSDLRTIVLRGEKLSPALFAPEQFENFAHHYGIHYVVLEHVTPSRLVGALPPWELLRIAPTPSMVLERVIPLSSSRPSFNGNLYIYRFTNPSPTPETAVKISMPKLNRELTIELDH